MKECRLSPARLDSLESAVVQAREELAVLGHMNKKAVNSKEEARVGLISSSRSGNISRFSIPCKSKSSSLFFQTKSQEIVFLANGNPIFFSRQNLKILFFILVEIIFSFLEKKTDSLHVLLYIWKNKMIIHKVYVFILHLYTPNCVPFEIGQNFVKMTPFGTNSSLWYWA